MRSYIASGILVFDRERGRACRGAAGGGDRETLREAGWEIVENGPFAIERYRRATIALGCTGDSVINSMSDGGFMCLGFGPRARLPA